MLTVLFLVTLGTVGCVACVKSLFAIMANAAKLSCLDVGHLECSRTLLAGSLHWKNFCVAVIAFQACTTMNFAVKNNLSHWSARKLNSLSGRNRHGAADKN